MTILQQRMKLMKKYNLQLSPDELFGRTGDQVTMAGRYGHKGYGDDDPAHTEAEERAMKQRIAKERQRVTRQMKRLGIYLGPVVRARGVVKSECPAK